MTEAEREQQRETGWLEAQRLAWRSEAEAEAEASMAKHTVKIELTIAVDSGQTPAQVVDCILSGAYEQPRCGLLLDWEHLETSDGLLPQGMTKYIVKWSVGGEESIEASSAEEAEAIMRETLSADTELPWLACQTASIEVEREQQQGSQSLVSRRDVAEAAERMASRASEEADKASDFADGVATKQPNGTTAGKQAHLQAAQAHDRAAHANSMAGIAYDFHADQTGKSQAESDELYTETPRQAAEACKAEMERHMAEATYHRTKAGPGMTVVRFLVGKQS